MTARTDFLTRLARLPSTEYFDAFFAETIEHGGIFDFGAIKTIDLHDVSVNHDSTEGAMIAWVRAAKAKEAEGDLAWAEMVLKDPQSFGCERRKAAQIILDHCRDAALRIVAQAELARLGGEAA
ncbi:MAG: hypothetical protein VX874_15730 [Pseudomonadota bacterium]|nr:hypothetical protein [Pseudomonadota bacterium]